MDNEKVLFVVFYQALKGVKNKTKKMDKLSRQTKRKIEAMRYTNKKISLGKNRWYVEQIPRKEYTAVYEKAMDIWKQIFKGDAEYSALVEVLLSTIDDFMGNTDKYYGRKMFNDAMLSCAYVDVSRGYETNLEEERKSEEGAKRVADIIARELNISRHNGLRSLKLQTENTRILEGKCLERL